MSDSDYSESSSNNSEESSGSDETPPQRQRKIARNHKQSTTNKQPTKQPTKRDLFASNKRSLERDVQIGIAEAIESTTGIADVVSLSDLFDKNEELFGKPNTHLRDTCRNRANYWRFTLCPTKPEKYLELLIFLGVTPFAQRPENRGKPVAKKQSKQSPKKKTKQSPKKKHPTLLTPSPAPAKKKKRLSSKKKTPPLPTPPQADNVVRLKSPVVQPRTKATPIQSPLAKMSFAEEIDETLGKFFFCLFLKSITSLTHPPFLFCTVYDIDEDVPHNNGPVKVWSFRQSKLKSNLYSGWHLTTSAHPYDVALDKYKLELIRPNVLKYTYPTVDMDFLQEAEMYARSARALNCFYDEIENLKKAYRKEVQSDKALQTRFVYYRLPENVVLTKGINSPKSVNGLIKMDMVPLKPTRKMKNGVVVALQPRASLSWNIILEGSEKPLDAATQQKSNADKVAELFGNFGI